MCKVMEIFDIQYTEYILKAQVLTPGWNLQAEIRKMILGCYGSKLRSLFVLLGRVELSMMGTFSWSRTVRYPWRLFLQTSCFATRRCPRGT